MRAHRLALALAAAALCLSGGSLADAASLDPGLDGTLGHVRYAAAGQPPPAAAQRPDRHPPPPPPSSGGGAGAAAFSAEHAARRAELLASMAPPADGSGVDFREDHPRFRVLRAMYGFARHQRRYQADLAGWEDGYKALSERHRDVRFPHPSPLRLASGRRAGRGQASGRELKDGSR